MNLWNPVYLQQKLLIFSRTFGREKLTEDEGSARTGNIIQYTTDEELVFAEF